MLKPYSKFQDFIVKHFKVILSFTSHFSPVILLASRDCDIMGRAHLPLKEGVDEINH